MTGNPFLRERLVVDSFIRTLPAFVEAVLSNGVLREEEWWIGNLYNAEGDSCSVNIRTGLWHDFATGEGGNAVQLWGRLFGLNPETEREAILTGMQAWTREGSLPDGTLLGAPETEGTLPPMPPVKALPWHYKHNAEVEAEWLQALETNRALKEEVAGELSVYRGLSTHLFCWLIERGHIGFFKVEKQCKNGDGTWAAYNIAFPVSYASGKTSLFFGLHLKWRGRNRSGWLYYPKDTCPALPLVLGAPVELAERIIISESSWDALAAIDLYRMWECSVPWMVISSRGAANLTYLYALLRRIPKTTRVKILWQNDGPGRKFVSRLPKRIYSRADHVIPPDSEGIKDLNDWMRLTGREAVLARLRGPSQV
jgi:hypothetical protein